MVTLRETAEGVVLNIKVKVCQPGFSVYKKGEDLVVEITSRPENNRANMEILKGMGKVFGKEAKILSGFKSKKKVVLISGLTIQDFEGKLASSCSIG